MLKASDEAALSPTYKTELRLFRGGFEEEGAAVAAKQNRRRGLGAKLRAAGQAVLASVLIADDAHRAARRRDPRRRPRSSWSGSAAARRSSGPTATRPRRSAPRAPRTGRGAGVDAPRRRLAPPRGPPRARRPASRSTTSTRRCCAASRPSTTAPSSPPRGCVEFKEREAAEAARAQRLASMKRRDEEIQLQRKLEKQKRWSRVRRFFGAGKRAPRRVPRGDGDESTVASTASRVGEGVRRGALERRATVASSNSGGHSGGHSGDHSGDATVASSANRGDLLAAHAAPTISFDDADADGESVQSPFDRG